MNSILILVIYGLMACGFIASYLSNAGRFTPSPDGEGWGEENPKHWLLVWGKFLLKGVATATDVLMSVLAPTGEILFFACPKKSTQKKRHPDAAFILRSSLLAGVAERGILPLRQRAASLPHPFGLIPPKAPVLGAANGITTTTLTTVICLSLLTLAVWPNASFACKSMYYPQSFPLEELKEYNQVYVVNVETVNYSEPLDESWYAPNFDFEGQIVEVLKGTGKPGDTIRGATDSTQEPQARCPIFIEAGKTYLLFLLGNSSPYVLPRFGSMYTPSSDSYTPSAASRFRQYITDIRRAQKKRHKKQQ